MTGVILAGGFGTRLGKITDKIPKPLIQIGAKPILLHIIDYYKSFEFDKFVICAGYLYSLVFESFLEMSEESKYIDQNVLKTQIDGTEVIIVNTGENTGTAQRLYKVKNYIQGESFALTYADGLSNINQKELIKHHFYKNKLVTLSAVHPMDRFGVITFDDSFIATEFSEKKKRNDCWINGGFMILKKDIFNFFDYEDYSLEKDVLPKLISISEVSVYLHEGFWQCMDTKDEHDYLEKLWASHEAPWASN